MGDVRVIEHRLPLPASARWAGRSTFCADWQQEVRCPVCGGDYVHPAGLRAFDDAGNKEARWCELTFRGECGHAFAVTFVFHKGQLFLRLEERIADRVGRPGVTHD